MHGGTLKLETTSFTSLHLIFSKMTPRSVNVRGVTPRHVTTHTPTSVSLFLVQQPSSGPGPPHSRGF